MILKTMSLNYPNVKRIDHFDDYFGTKVFDPYRYMENPADPETMRFVEENNQLVSKFVNQEYLDHYTKRMQNNYKYQKVSVPIKRGNKLFYVKSIEGAPQIVIVQRDETGQEKVIFDLNKLSEDGTTGSMLQYYSHDGEKAAIFVTEKGSDWQYIQILDVGHNEQLEKLKWVTMSEIAWLKDNSGFNNE